MITNKNKKSKPISPSNDDKTLKDEVLLTELLKQAVNKFGIEKILTKLNYETKPYSVPYIN